MGATCLAASQVARLRPELGPWVRPALRKAGRTFFLKPTFWAQGLGFAQALSAGWGASGRRCDLLCAKKVAPMGQAQALAVRPAWLQGRSHPWASLSPS